MNEHLAAIVLYANGIAFYIMTYYGFTRVFKPNIKKRWIFLAYAAYLVISSQQFLHFGNVWMNLAINAIAFIGLSLMFAGNVSIKIVFALLMNAIGIFADVTSFIGIEYIYLNLHGVGMPQEYAFIVVRTIINIIFAPLLLIQVSLFKRYLFSKAQRQHFKIPKKYTGAVLAIMSSIILINGVFSAIAVAYIKETINLLLIIQFISLLAIFLIIWLYNTILNHLESLEKSRLKERASEKWETQYKTAMNAQKSMAKINHDLRYHFLSLSSYLKEGKMDELEKHIEGKLGEIYSVMNTGNISIDTMFNYYTHQIKEHLGIDLDVDGIVPSGMRLKAEFVANILGNALENAIEACSKVELISERYINVKMAITQREPFRTFMITITNSYEIEPVTDKNGNLITTKDDKRNHGLGVAGITELLPEEDGQIHFRYSDNKFQFMVLFYNV